MPFIFLMGKIYFFYNIRLFMYSNDLKTKAINLYYKLNSYRKVQELLDIGKSTVQRWVFCDKKNIRKCFDKTEIILFIKSLLDNDCFISCKMIGETIYRKYKKILSKSLIYTIITKSIKYSYKKINKKIYSKNIQDLVFAQNIFSKNIEKINKNNIICVDETYIYSNYSSNRGWGKKGCYINKYIRANPVKYSILMAISNNIIIYKKIYKNNIQTKEFVRFIKFINRKYKNKYILMDNVSFHKTKLVKTLIDKSSNKLLYIPPYSPQFNPIEEVFSQIKRNINYIKKGDIIQKFNKSISFVTANNLKNYYKHAFFANNT